MQNSLIFVWSVSDEEKKFNKIDTRWINSVQQFKISSLRKVKLSLIYIADICSTVIDKNAGNTSLCTYVGLLGTTVTRNKPVCYFVYRGNKAKVTGTFADNKGNVYAGLNTKLWKSVQMNPNATAKVAELASTTLCNVIQLESVLLTVICRPRQVQTSAVVVSFTVHFAM